MSLISLIFKTEFYKAVISGKHFSHSILMILSMCLIIRPLIVNFQNVGNFSWELIKMSGIQKQNFGKSREVKIRKKSIEKH